MVLERRRVETPSVSPPQTASIWLVYTTIHVKGVVRQTLEAALRVTEPPNLVFQLVQEMTQGNRRALARLFSLLEKDSDTLSAVMRRAYPHVRGAYTIGITGPPGAGKSTIVDGLIQVARDEGASVGVLAVDPTSPFSGGAVLGDRIRMQRHYLDQGVFIRSLATRGVQGGLSRVVWASLKLLDAFGKDVIMVETVGVGQTELDIMKVADTVVVTLVPEAGDSIQAMKAGLMEIADIFVVNKSDRDGADRLVTAIKTMLDIGGMEQRWRPPIISTQAHRRLGIPELYEAIQQRHESLEQSLDLERRRRERRTQEFALALKERTEAAIAELMSPGGTLNELAARVEDGELDPYTAAARALNQGLLFAGLAKTRSTRDNG